MLTRLRVQGYKALRDVSVAFDPLTVIVGPNGCGKSSLLEAIELVRDSVRQDSRFALRQDRASRLFEQRIRAIHRLHFDIGALSRPSLLPEPKPVIRPDGTGLATVLDWLLGERDGRFDEIETRLREFVPEVRRIRTKRVSMEMVEFIDIEVGKDKEGNDVYAKRSCRREGTGHQVVIDYEHAYDVPATHASKGTLLLLGLITTAVTTHASILLLDDIERGLHPKTQQHLVGYLEKLTSDGLQIIATSHSPYLLLHLGYEQVRAMTLAGARGSLIGKLSDHPEFDRWKEEMSPSEFWTVFGESWLKGSASA